MFLPGDKREKLQAKSQAAKSQNWRVLKAIAMALSEGTKSRALQTLAEEILVWAECILASLLASRLKGTLSLVADFQSRHWVLEEDWT